MPVNLSNSPPPAPVLSPGAQRREAYPILSAGFARGVTFGPQTDNSGLPSRLLEERRYGISIEPPKPHIVIKPVSLTRTHRPDIYVQVMNNGDKYIGPFVNGLRHGDGVWHRGGVEYRGPFVQGKLHGVVTMKMPFGQQFVGLFEHGVAISEPRPVIAEMEPLVSLLLDAGAARSVAGSDTTASSPKSGVARLFELGTPSDVAPSPPKPWWHVFSSCFRMA